MGAFLFLCVCMVGAGEGDTEGGPWGQRAKLGLKSPRACAGKVVRSLGQGAPLPPWAGSRGAAGEGGGIGRVSFSCPIRLWLANAAQGSTRPSRLAAGWMVWIGTRISPCLPLFLYLFCLVHLRVQPHIPGNCRLAASRLPACHLSGSNPGLSWSQRLPGVGGRWGWMWLEVSLRGQRA